MSSKGRGKASQPSDFYPTDERVTRDFLRRWEAGRGPLPAGVWFEPAVGDGAILRAVAAHTAAGGGVGPVHAANWRTCDVRAEASTPETAGTWRHHRGDFLAVKPSPTGPSFAAAVEDASVVIANPPFTLAESFVRHARALCPKAWIAMLLRVGFLEADERIPFWRDFPDVDLFPIVPRPSFGTNKHGKKGTDSAAYAWMVWTPPSEIARGAPRGARVHFPAEPWCETRRTKREARERAEAEAAAAKTKGAQPKQLDLLATIPAAAARV